MSGFR